MGKINKALEKVKSNAINLSRNINELKVSRKQHPNKTADCVKNITKSARIMKASIRSFSSLFANFIIGDIDSSLQLVQKSSKELQDAHRNMNLPLMEESLNEIENNSELLPKEIDQLQDFITAFENFPQFKASLHKLKLIT